jgi:hypothetical protein
MSARILVATLALGWALPAQSPATFPSDHASIANGASQTNWFPYAYGVSRIQAVYETWDLTVPAGHAITRIGFRQEGSLASTGHQLQLQVLMGPTDKTAADITTTYANNYFAPPTSVFGPAVFNLPSLTTSTTGNIVWLQLTTPFTPPAGHNLLVEFVVIANNNAGAAFPYYLDVANFVSVITSGSPGCPHSGNQVPHLLSRATEVGGTWYCDLSLAPASQLAVWFINFGQLVSPYPLSPFIPGIAPTCMGQLSLSNLATVTASTSANGSHTFSALVPNSRFYNDLVISSQVACLDFFAPGGVAVSNADQMQIGIEPAMSVIFSQGSSTATTGSVYRNYGVVTLFDYQ